MDYWLAILAPLLLSAAGGLADFLLDDKHSWKELFKGLFLALFCGVIVMLLFMEEGFSAGKMSAWCGLAGLGSRGILKFFRKRAMEAVEKKI